MRTKVVATVGPATASPDMILALARAGVDVFRLNLAHGSAEDHGAVVRWVRAASDTLEKPIAVLADLAGPKIRIGRLAEPVPLVEDTEIIVAPEGIAAGDELPSTYEALAEDVSPGDRVLLDDGLLELRVEEVRPPRVRCRVIRGGLLRSGKGMNLPGVQVSAPALTEKDLHDLEFALSAEVDYIGLSFVQRAEDIVDLRSRIPNGPLIIAKIEKDTALENIESILLASDAVMVARGDLGVELPLEMVPIVQKRAIELARRSAKPVIVATQVLESMISAPRPTRAEASDCANAVLDGADAVMLSGETSVGEYPIEAVRTMARIIENTEQHGRDRIAPLGWSPQTRGGAVTHAAAEVGETLGAKYLVTFTQSGDSARRMSRLRSPIPLLAFTPVAEVRSRLALSWGVQTYQVPHVAHTDAMVLQVDQTLLVNGLAEEGDLVVIVFGAPVGVPGTTNSLVVHRIGGDRPSR